jgi:hypothetical protein
MRFGSGLGDSTDVRFAKVPENLLTPVPPPLLVPEEVAFVGISIPTF